MNLVSCVSHLFIFLVGILLAIPFALLLIRILALKTSPEHINQRTSFRFASPPPQADVRTSADRRTLPHAVWMLSGAVTSSPARTQLVFVKLHESYLFVHVTGKRMRRVRSRPVRFAEVLIFDYAQAKVNLTLHKHARTQYWSPKTPIVLSQLQFIVRYRIVRKSKNGLHKLSFAWVSDRVGLSRG